MKTLIIGLIMAIVLIAGCAETISPTAWIITGSDLDTVDNPIIGRVGVNSEGVEAGLELNYTGGHIVRHSYGAYILYELQQQIIGTTPYMGFHAVIAEDDIEERYGPIVGTLVDITPQVQAVVEAQYTEQAAATDEFKAFAGIRAKF